MNSNADTTQNHVNNSPQSDIYKRLMKIDSSKAASYSIALSRVLAGKKRIVILKKNLQQQINFLRQYADTTNADDLADHDRSRNSFKTLIGYIDQTLTDIDSTREHVVHYQKIVDQLTDVAKLL